MEKYIVTALGPIDRHLPGEDVAGVYEPELLKRLIEEGYISVKPGETSAPRRISAQKRGKGT